MKDKQIIEYLLVKKKLIAKRKVGSLFWMDSPMDNYKMLSVGCSNFPFSFNRKKDPVELFFPQHILPFNGNSKISAVSAIW